MLTLHVADLLQLADRRVECAGGNHEGDDAGPDLVRRVVDGRVRLRLGAGDVAAVRLDEAAHLGQLGAERPGLDRDADARLPDDRRSLEGGHRVGDRGRSLDGAGRGRAAAGAVARALLRVRRLEGPAFRGLLYGLAATGDRDHHDREDYEELFHFESGLLARGGFAVRNARSRGT